MVHQPFRPDLQYAESRKQPLQAVHSSGNSSDGVLKTRKPRNMTPVIYCLNHPAESDPRFRDAVKHRMMMGYKESEYILDNLNDAPGAGGQKQKVFDMIWRWHCLHSQEHLEHFAWITQRVVWF